jgi:alpha-D-ribose 1-methylphosphonate 5-triphosphate synthase subunit PhnL
MTALSVRYLAKTFTMHLRDGVVLPVSVPHDQFVAAFKLWADAGGPCPE